MHLLTMSQKYCACQAKLFSTHYETRLNATTCHACHAKQSYVTLKTSKNGILLQNLPYRHGRSVLRRTAADACEGLRTQTHNVQRTHPPPPGPKKQEPTGYAFGKIRPQKHVSTCVKPRDVKGNWNKMPGDWRQVWQR